MRGGGQVRNGRIWGGGALSLWKLEFFSNGGGKRGVLSEIGVCTGQTAAQETVTS